MSDVVGTQMLFFSRTGSYDMLCYTLHDWQKLEDRRTWPERGKRHQMSLSDDHVTYSSLRSNGISYICNKK